MELSKYVFQVEDQYLDLTTKILAPITSSEEYLRERFMLQGQERQALDHALFSTTSPASLSLKIQPTWECNLRCTHCFVLEKLKKRDDNELDVQRLKGFVDRYHTRFKESLRVVTVAFFGGEIALKAEKCNEIMDAVDEVTAEHGTKASYNLTTNGTILNEEFVRVLQRCKVFTISLDGNRESHNNQRIPLGSLNPYDTTILNIKKIVMLGLANKLIVQAAIRPEVDSYDLGVDFYTSLIHIGIKPENIICGMTVPTRRNDPEEMNELFRRREVFLRPCCKFRCGVDFEIDTSNNIYSDYFLDSKASVLGDLDDDIDMIVSNHRKQIGESMPALNDPKCLECPVIGACWGRCCNTHLIKNPSDVCDQEGFVEFIEELRSKGNLLDIVKDMNLYQRKKLIEEKHDYR